MSPQVQTPILPKSIQNKGHERKRRGGERGREKQRGDRMIEGVNMKLHYMSIWKCHNVTLCCVQFNTHQ
jgi:hypothetical protein